MRNFCTNETLQHRGLYAEERLFNFIVKVRRFGSGNICCVMLL